MKFVLTLVLALVAAFVSWPYYYLYRLDDALGRNDLLELMSLVDLQAVQAQAAARRERTVDRIGDQLTGGQPQPGTVLAAVQDGVKELIAKVSDEDRSIEQVRDILQTLARSHTDASPPYFIAAVDYAFFESLDSFLIRLGAIDEDPAYVRLGFEHGRWMVTDIVD